MEDIAVHIAQHSTSEETPANNTKHNSQPSPTSNQKPQEERGCLIVKVCTLLFWPIIIIVIPIILIYGFASCIHSWCRGDKRNKKQSFPDVVEAFKTAQRFVNALRNIRNSLVVAFLIWLTFNLSVPWLKNKDLYGTKLWRWSLLIAMLSCGYNLIDTATRFVLSLLRSNKKFRTKKNAVYFAERLRRSVNFILLSGSFHLTWIFYFKKATPTDKISQVGSWIFSMLFLWAVLSLIKKILLLKWEADAWWRLSDRILNAGIQLYFVSRIREWKFGIFHIWSKQHKPTDQVSKGEEVGAATDENKESNDKKKGRAKDILCIKWKPYGKKDGTFCLTLTKIRQMTKYFVAVKKLSREDDGTVDIQHKLSKPGRSIITAKDLKEFDIDIDEETLKAVLEKDCSYQNFERWMIKGNKNCLALGYTLSDAKDVVKLLDKVMTCFIVMITIAWFLVSNIAETRILLLIASPFLGATYVFGNTFKTIFEGIIFSFINHPFDVGDRCIIDGVELEVKHMGILTTKFRSIDTEKEVLHPNSALASKCITNLRWEPDPNDNVEVILDCNWTHQMIKDLRKKIKGFFKNNGDKEGNNEDKESNEDERHKKENNEDDKENNKDVHYMEDPTIAIEEIGDSIKMKIQFQHVLNIHEGTYSHCRKKKNTQRSKLLFKVKEFMDAVKPGEFAKAGAENSPREGVAKTGAEYKAESEAGEAVANTGDENKAENEPGGRVANTRAEIQNQNACSLAACLGESETY